MGRKYDNHVMWITKNEARELYQFLSTQYISPEKQHVINVVRDMYQFLNEKELPEVTNDKT